jgi:hypothetical protein
MGGVNSPHLVKHTHDRRPTETCTGREWHVVRQRGKVRLEERRQPAQLRRGGRWRQKRDKLVGEEACLIQCGSRLLADAVIAQFEVIKPSNIAKVSHLAQAAIESADVFACEAGWRRGYQL